MSSVIRAFLWLSILVAGAGPTRWLFDYITAPTILLSLQDAVYSPNPEAGPSQHLFPVDGDVRLAIFSHPPSRVEWTLDLRPGPHRFLVEVALDPEVWESSDGVRSKVILVEGERRRQLVERIVDPKGQPEDRRWVPLATEFVTTTGRATLALVNDAGPAGQSDFDWAYWAGPRVVSRTRPPDARLVLAGLVGVVAVTLVARRRGVSLRRDLRGLTLAVYSILVSVVLAELVLRQFPSWLPPGGIVHDVAGHQFAAWADRLVPDPDLAYRYRSGLSLSLPRNFRGLVPETVVPYVEPRTDWIRFETDADGFRNEPRAGPPEIVVLGDSFAAGDLVDGAATVSSVLSQESGAVVRSLAVSGYGPQQYLGALRDYGIRDRPRVVVVVLFEGNDVDDAEFFVRWRESNQAWLSYAMKVLRVREPSIVTRPRMRARLLAALSRMALVASSVASRPEDPFNPVCRHRSEVVDCVSFNGTMIFRETISPEEQRARPGLGLTVDALREIQSIGDGAGAKVLVVLAPTKESIHLPRMSAYFDPGRLDRFLNTVARGVAIAPGPSLAERFSQNKGTVGRLLKEHLEREGMAVLDLRPEFEMAVDQGRELYFRFDLHWSEAGHAEVARFIQREIARRGWLKSPTRDGTSY